MQRVGMTRLGDQYLLVKRPGFGKATGLMRSDRLLKQGLNLLRAGRLHDPDVSAPSQRGTGPG
jgi:hypothetical protein